MPRPVTLFTGQWADLPLAKLLPLVKKMGYDGVELSCWGDHFEVDRALSEPDYLKNKWALLKKNGLSCYAISTHLVGQAVCDLIDERHRAILPAAVWGDGKPEGVRPRRAQIFQCQTRRRQGRARHCQRLYRFLHLARRLCLPAHQPGIFKQR